MLVHARLELHIEHRQSTAADTSQQLLSLFGGPNPVDIFQLEKKLNKKTKTKALQKVKTVLDQRAQLQCGKGLVGITFSLRMSRFLSPKRP